MFHPDFNVSELSEDEIQKKLADISKKLSNPRLRSDVVQQLRNFAIILQTAYKEKLFKKSIENDPSWAPGTVLDTSDEKIIDDELTKLININ